MSDKMSGLFVISFENITKDYRKNRGRQFVLRVPKYSNVIGGCCQRISRQRFSFELLYSSIFMLVPHQYKGSRLRSITWCKLLHYLSLKHPTESESSTRQTLLILNTWSSYSFSRKTNEDDRCVGFQIEEYMLIVPLAGNL